MGERLLFVNNLYTSIYLSTADPGRNPIFETIEVNSEVLPFVPATMVDLFSHGWECTQLFLHLLWKKNKCLQLYARLLERGTNTESGNGHPTENQSGFLCFFPLPYTSYLCLLLYVEHQLKINFLLQFSICKWFLGHKLRHVMNCTQIRQGSFAQSAGKFFLGRWRLCGKLQM